MTNIKMIALSTFCALATVVQSCGSNTTPEMQKYEARQEILQVNTRINELKMEYEQERVKNGTLRTEARELSEKAETKTDRFSVGNDAASVADRAASTRKSLKKAEKAVNELLKSDRKLEKLKQKITKEQGKAAGLERQIQYVKPQQ